MNNNSTPTVNTHVHFPPNFSAYQTPEAVIDAAIAENAAAVGISNFYDQSVYQWFLEAANKAGIVPLFGLEFITLDPELQAEGIRINDPANPGRMYFCGKGINITRDKTAFAAQTGGEIRRGNDERANQMVSRLADWYAKNGIETGLTSASIAENVAERAGVPAEWVSLQERHIAAAFAEALDRYPAVEKKEILRRIYGKDSVVDIEDPVALQGEIRSNLLKTGTVGFVPEVPLSFDQAYRYVLDMGGIPTYPTLADGVEPVCPFEVTPSDLAERLLEKQIFAAELIPIRNHSRIVDEYVNAFLDAGMIVMAGTEHNTLDQIPLDPACVDGPVSEYARQAFWEGACVVAAHQQRVANGLPGYVDEGGARTPVSKEELAGEGATLLSGK